MILHNGSFYSMSSPDEIFIGLTVEQGRITDVYRKGEEKRLFRDAVEGNAETLDCGGAYCTPGFVDTHTHAFEGGFYHNCVSLKNAQSIEGVLTLLEAGRPLDGKIIAWEFQEHTVKEHRWPSLEELDRLFPNTPCMIRRVDGHSSVINSAAASQIPWQGKAPDISVPVRAAENHEVSAWFHRDISNEEILNAYHTAAGIAADFGIVRVHTMIGDGKDDLRHYRLIQDHLGDFDVEFVLYPQVRSASAALTVESPRMGGCLLTDGSIGSRTAALDNDYADSPGNRGLLYNTDAEWVDIFDPAMRAGLDVCVHAIGDRAISQIAGLYSALTANYKGKGFRNQVIHCEMTPDPVVESLVEAGACCVMQPLFEAYWGDPGGLYETRLGAERAALCDRFRTLIDAGLLVTGGSDWYITEMDVLAGIRGAVNHHVPRESITPYEGFALYTKNAASLIHREAYQGKLLPGYEAEIVFLSRDPMEKANLADNRILGTYMKGAIEKSGKMVQGP